MAAHDFPLQSGPSTLIGVGVGPGDPDLLAVRAADLLAGSDRVPGSAG